MVGQVVRLFNREFSRLEEAAILLGVSSLASQLLALIRDRVLAARFGAGRELDIYYAAFRVPDLIYVAVASLVSLTVVIPALVSKFDQGDSSRAKTFLNSLFTVFSLLMLFVVFLAFVSMPLIVKISTPGFSLEDSKQLIGLSRLLLFSPFLLGLSNLLASITQSFKKFFVYALSPIFYNLGIIIGIIFLAPQLGLLGLGFGVVLGASLHLLIQLPTVWSLGLLPRPTLKIVWQEVREIVFLSLPRTLALSVHQLVILVLVGIASLMAAGSVAVFNFAYNLQAVPLAIIGMSYSVAAFPTLVQQFRSGEKQVFLEQVSRAVRHIIFWSLPFAVLLIVLRAQVIRVILGAGQFDWADTRLTAAAVAVFSLSLVAQSLILLLVRAYYAAGLSRRPLLVNGLSSGVIVLIGLVFAWLTRGHPSFAVPLAQFLRIYEVPGAELLILPAAFSLGLLLNLFWLWSCFRKDFGSLPKTVGRSVREVFLASLAAGFASYFILNLLASHLDQNTFIGIFAQGLAAGLVGILVLVLILRFFGNEEFSEVSQAFSKRFWRSRVIAPEPEEL